MCAKTGKKRRRSHTGFSYACTLAQVKTFVGSEVFAQRNSLLLLLFCHFIPFSTWGKYRLEVDAQQVKELRRRKICGEHRWHWRFKKGSSLEQKDKKEKCKDVRCRRIILANSFWMQYFGWEVLSLHLILINSRTQPIGSSFPDRGWLSERSTII